MTFFSAAGPNKLIEVAPYVTLVGVGAHYVGGFTINKKTFNRFPPEVQKLFIEVGRDYTNQAAKVQAEAQETFRVQMEKGGAKFSTLPAGG